MIAPFPKCPTFVLFALLGLIAFPLAALSQDEMPEKSAEASTEKQANAPEGNQKEDGDSTLGEITGHVEKTAEDINQSEEAQEISAGILKPIYTMAEYLSFSGVHWVAFAVMVAGVVSFALQLVLAKLVVLAKFGFSMTSILSDALGLVISIVGLVLTTQAAAENSNFTKSPAAVLSAAVVGLLVGFVFYWWGQAEEVQAVEGRKLRSGKGTKAEAK